MNTKGRPRKKKVIQEQPRIDHFSPRGRPGRPDEIILNLEEFEAVRLHDFSGYDQKRSARIVGLPR